MVSKGAGYEGIFDFTTREKRVAQGMLLGKCEASSYKGPAQ
jgi:hypothetical protein